MYPDFTFSIEKFIFDENYQPSNKTRLTTNFANLARGENRKENLRRTIQMMNNRFNSGITPMVIAMRLSWTLFLRI